MRLCSNYIALQSYYYNTLVKDKVLQNVLSVHEERTFSKTVINNDIQSLNPYQWQL